MSDPLLNIFSAENIARSRARAAGIREMVAAGTLTDSWATTADAIDADADERELGQGGDR